MTHSIRLRLVNWLERIGNHVAKHFVQVLGRSKMHSQADGNLSNAFPVRVQYAGAKAYCNDPVSLAGLSYQINELNRLAIVPNLPSVGAHRKFVARSYDHLIAHQPLPFPTPNILPSQTEAVESPKRRHTSREGAVLS